MEKFRATVNPMKAVPFVKRQDAIAKAVDKEDIGTTVLFDGTGYVCDVNFIPGVTKEMIDWWFVFRGLERDNYVGVNPKENLSALTMQKGKSVDPDLTMQERLWDTTQEVVKLGEMGPASCFQNFKCPTDIGFDISSLGDNASVICIRGFEKGEPPMAGPDSFTLHIVKEKDGGVEITTYMWIGWTVMYGMDKKALPDGFFMPMVFPTMYLVKNTMEWMSVGKALPELYKEKGGAF